MQYLIQQFGLFPGWLLAAFAIFFRYILFAGLAFIIFYWLGKHFFAPQKIQGRNARWANIRAEVLHSAYTALVFALIGLVLFGLRTAGFTKIYAETDTHGLGYIPLSFLLLVLIHDTYFYWIHRLMHHRLFFKWLHKVHHQSFNPTPWAALSFHPLEAIVEVAIVPLAALIIPLHPFTLLLFATWSLAWNVIGHLGYEIFPAGFTKHPLFKWFNTSTHHNMHHERSGGNYGLYFNFWDWLMDTNHADYHLTFERITGNSHVSEGD